MNNRSAFVRDTAATAGFAFKEYFRPLLLAGGLLKRLVYRSRSPVPSATLAGPSSASLGITREMIAKRAYQLWRDRGCPHGSHQADWIEAETQLRAEMTGKPMVQPAVRDGQPTRDIKKTERRQVK